MSTHIRGNPDLDYRPRLSSKTLIESWIQRCERCGYCAPKISAWYTEKDAEIVKSEEYRAQLNHPGYPELANSFLCFSIIMEKTGKYYSAGFYSHCAAWACDDAENYEGAKNCRKRAVELFDKAPEKSYKIRVIEVDLLRRAELFEEAMKRSREIIEGPVDLNALVDIDSDKPEKEQVEKKMANYRIFMKILQYQMKLIEKRDASCHTIDEALGIKPVKFYKVPLDI
jgi:hypothetical protein